MIKTNLKPFNKKELIAGLKKEFPKYKIQTGLGGLQVRTSRFTITGNVKINAKPKKGIIITKTGFDYVAFYLLFSFPVGLYILFKQKKQKRMEKEVVEKIKEILPQ